MTATVVPKKLETEWLQFLKQKEEDKEDLEMEAYYNGLVSRMQRNNPVKVDIGLPPNLQEDKGYGIFVARARKAAPPLPPSEKDNFAKIEVSLRNQRSWFLKQNEELLKLLDCLHKQEYDEAVQEEEILDRISDFTLVLFEYVKTLKKRKGRGAVCV